MRDQKPPGAQSKLVEVISGKIWDVAVDIRKQSPTFKKWVACELSSDNHHMLFVPAGFAHGFIVLSDKAHVYYKCTSEYDPSLECGIRWNDRDIGIEWPAEKPILSERDWNLPDFADTELSFSC